MSLREMPRQFGCDACEQRQLLDALCVDASSAVVLRCVHCCGCLAHGDVGEMPGTVVFAGTPLTWRGLDGSAWRTRRHH